MYMTSVTSQQLPSQVIQYTCSLDLFFVFAISFGMEMKIIMFEAFDVIVYIYMDKEDMKGKPMASKYTRNIPNIL